MTRSLPILLIGAVLGLSALSMAQAAPDPDPATQPMLLASLSHETASAPVERVNSYGLARDDRPPDELRLNLDGRDIVIIFATGDVKLGEGLTVDEASQAFWKRVGQLAPSFCNGRAAQQTATPQH